MEMLVVETAVPIAAKGAAMEEYEVDNGTAEVIVDSEEREME